MTFDPNQNKQDLIDFIMKPLREENSMDSKLSNRLGPTTPTGKRIVARVDTIHGFAGLTGGHRKPDGTLEIDWTGSTEVIWDTQEALKEGDDEVYRDEDGIEWSGKDVIWPTEAEEELVANTQGVPDVDQ